MPEFFDYATILLRIAELNKQIHGNIIDGKYSDNTVLTKELLWQTRLLHLWHIQELEKYGHRYD